MGDAAPRRVFLSHTAELADGPVGGSYVAAAVQGIIRAGDTPVEMGTFPAAAVDPGEFCRRQVEACDVLVVLAGRRYGSVLLDRSDRSFVECEYAAAGAAGKPRLAFLLACSDADPADARQEAFRARLRRDGVTAEFSSPLELQMLLFQALVAREPGARRSAALPRVTAYRSRNIQVGDHNTQFNGGGFRRTTLHRTGVLVRAVRAVLGWLFRR